jgi:hypothetical protein
MAVTISRAANPAVDTEIHTRRVSDLTLCPQSRLTCDQPRRGSTAGAHYVGNRGHDGRDYRHDRRAITRSPETYTRAQGDLRHRVIGCMCINTIPAHGLHPTPNRLMRTEVADPLPSAAGYRATRRQQLSLTTAMLDLW